jgi:Cellulase (glycosyl hydrolase family 5)
MRAGSTHAPGSRPRGRHPNAALAAVVAGTVAALGLTACAHHAPSPTPTSPSTTATSTATSSPTTPASSPPPGKQCGNAVGPFRVQGTQVLGSGGKVFLSYGITVPGLVDPGWKGTSEPDDMKIAATTNDWCGNTIRLQLSQDNLLGPRGTAFNQDYLKAIESEVSTAERYHLVVVLNDSTESPPSTGVGSYQRGPTPGTETFWRDLAKVYGSNPQVIFDLFNEPRNTTGLSQAATWSLWRNGGTFDGDHYLGMEQLASYVRNTVHAKNLFWVEGPNYSDSFSGLERYHGLLTKVSNVVYAIHHPLGPHTRAGWYVAFGYLINTRVAPVVEGEWTNYAPPPGKPNSECWSDAPTKVPEYLQYLFAHGVGMNAYQLAQYLLIKFKDNYRVPTTINPKTWNCTPKTELDQGAGSLIMNWFKLHNS